MEFWLNTQDALPPGAAQSSSLPFLHNCPSDVSPTASCERLAESVTLGGFETVPLYSVPGTLLSASANKTGSACHFGCEESGVPRTEVAETAQPGPGDPGTQAQRKISMACEASFGEDSRPGLGSLPDADARRHPPQLQHSSCVCLKPWASRCFSLPLGAPGGSGLGLVNPSSSVALTVFDS